MSETNEGAQGKKRGCMYWGLVALVVLIGLAILIGIFAEPPTEEEKAARAAEERAEREAEAQGAIDGATRVTAMELWSAFDRNEVAAQSAYGDRPLLVTGTVDSIELDFMDEPVVSLQTGNQFQSVQLDFDKGDAAEVGALGRGTEIAALCTELGEVIGTPMLDDCTLVEMPE